MGNEGLEFNCLRYKNQTKLVSTENLDAMKQTIGIQYNDLSINSRVVSAVIFGLGDFLEENDITKFLELSFIDFLILGLPKSEVDAAGEFKRRFLKEKRELRVDIRFSRRSFGLRKRGERETPTDKAKEVLSFAIFDPLKDFAHSALDPHKTDGVIHTLEELRQDFLESFDVSKSPWMTDKTQHGSPRG